MVVNSNNRRPGEKNDIEESVEGGSPGGKKRGINESGGGQWFCI